MIVVADTAPINYLVLIQEIDLLPKLYGEVAIPQAVLHELLASRSPEPVRMWVENRPAWVRVEQVSGEAFTETAEFLDAGEREAIALARAIRAKLLIIDERAGRREALRLNLPVTGTLGVLLAASTRGIIELHPVLDRLRRTSFYLPANLIENLMRDPQRP